MLVKMGYNPKRGIGLKPQIIKPVVVKIRDKNKGLGSEFHSFSYKTLESKNVFNNLKERKKKESSSVFLKPTLKKKKITWIRKGCLVRVLTKIKGPNFYFKNGVVLDILSNFNLTIMMKEQGGTILELDESEVETVIPNYNSFSILIFGKRKGEIVLFNKKHKKNDSLIQLKDSSINSEPNENICAFLC